MIWRVITLTSLALLAGWAGWQVSDRSPPVVVYSAKPEGPAVAGGPLRIAYTLNRLRQCDTIVDRMVVDSRQTRFILDPLVFATGAGPIGQEQYVSVVNVPVQAAPGPAIYRTTSRFTCSPINALWPIYAPSREIGFVIEP
ncbi:hypothetical protein [Ancylobacter sp.]|uniref:hypothetical protein n=1 Tax=Ancylobacter sp. TaxID=1872567 RepID=UPI003D14C79F